MHSDDAVRQPKVLTKAFAVGILMPCPEEDQHLVNISHPHPQFSELPDAFSCLWVTVRLLFSPPSLIIAQLPPDKEGAISVYSQSECLNPAFAFLSCSLFQLLLGIAKEGTGQHLTWAPPDQL